MDLVKLESTVPIKTIPEQELNRIILMQFTLWVANLLSLTDETSADRLETALPAIKEHCWSMGFSEIKKMFEMYADNKLSIKPIPNYFDRILLGKIVEAYKEQKQVPKKQIQQKVMSEQEKNKILKSGVKRLYAEFENIGFVPPGNIHLYDYLYDKGLLIKDVEEKKTIYEKAKENIKIKYESNTNYLERKNTKIILENIQNGQDQNIKNQYIIEAKRLSIEKFMEKVKENDGLIDLYLDI